MAEIVIKGSEADLKHVAKTVHLAVQELQTRKKLQDPISVTVVDDPRYFPLKEKS